MVENRPVNVLFGSTGILAVVLLVVDLVGQVRATDGLVQLPDPNTVSASRNDLSASDRNSLYDMIYRPYHGHGRQWYIHGYTYAKPQGGNSGEAILPSNVELVENLFQSLLQNENAVQSGSVGMGSSVTSGTTLKRSAMNLDDGGRRRQPRSSSLIKRALMQMADGGPIATNLI